MTSWVKCSDVENGMLPGEYAVEMETSDDGTVSLFAREDKVKPAEKLIRVEVLKDSNGGGTVLVSLPAPAFEISSRTVRVPQDNLVKFE